MGDSDDPADKAADPAADGQETVSALRRRTAKARAERAARLAKTLRANLGRRKQQTRSRESGGADEDPAS